MATTRPAPQINGVDAMTTPAIFDAPAFGGAVITKNKGAITTSQGTFRALYVGGTGTVTPTMLDGSTPLFSAVPAGTVLPIQFTMIPSNGSSATLLVGLY